MRTRPGMNIRTESKEREKKVRSKTRRQDEEGIKDKDKREEIGEELERK